jgi:GGDEF domain-containing protein
MTDQLTEAVATTPELEAWIQLTDLILGAVSDHVVQCGESDADPFRHKLQESMTMLKNRPTAPQVLIAAGSLSQAITNYSGQTQRRVDFLLGELRSLVQMLVSHLSETPGTSIDSNRALAEAGASVQSAVLSGEFSASRQKLANTLKSYRQESETRRVKADELTNRLHDRITILEQTTTLAGHDALAPPRGAASDLDPCTGLPNRAEGEAAIRRALAANDRTYLAVFYLHRMNLANARFGKAIGDQVIQFCAQHLSAFTKNGDSLYRWSGPAFVAILRRQESQLRVTSEIQRVSSAPLSRFFETDSRSVYLPIKLSSAVIGMGNETYAQATDQIERFILGASGGADASE